MEIRKADRMIILVKSGISLKKAFNLYSGDYFFKCFITFILLYQNIYTYFIISYHLSLGPSSSPLLFRKMFPGRSNLGLLLSKPSAPIHQPSPPLSSILPFLTSSFSHPSLVLLIFEKFSSQILLCLL